MTPQELQTEIMTDPKALGYAQHVTSGNDSLIAKLLNTVGASSETISREAVTSAEVIMSIVYSEYATLTQAQRDYIAAVIASGNVDASNANISNGLLSAFGAGTQTRTKLIAIASRPASRYEILNGRGSYCTDATVAIALRGV